jgi:AraC family transcriptional regulator, regulatory protein of adaptative response / methylated-DNA-[protein]-cysteine methyltransferase
MITSTTIKTVLGEMISCSVEDGICLLEFTDRKTIKKEISYLEKYFGAIVQNNENKHFVILKEQLEEYFEGIRKEFTIPLFAPGTEFQRAVWNELLRIPYGNTRSYMEQSIALGKPDSIRAVAMANSQNRIAIIIPCHRIIGSDGKLTGYSGGLERKKWLLEHEKKHSGQAVELSLF